MSGSITFAIGQAVTWRHSALGFAQIDDLMRTRVRLIYRTKRGTFRRPVVPAAELNQEPMLFELSNPLNRAERRKSKTYRIA